MIPLPLLMMGGRRAMSVECKERSWSECKQGSSRQSIESKQRSSSAIAIILPHTTALNVCNDGKDERVQLVIKW
jgi:hypothetical protein